MIRREIGNMFRDGTLAVTMAKYSYYGLDDTWASYDLMEAAERARRMAWGIGALAMAVTVALWRSLLSTSAQAGGGGIARKRGTIPCDLLSGGCRHRPDQPRWEMAAPEQSVL